MRSKGSSSAVSGPRKKPPTARLFFNDLARVIGIVWRSRKQFVVVSLVLVAILSITPFLRGYALGGVVDALVAVVQQQAEPTILLPPLLGVLIASGVFAGALVMNGSLARILHHEFMQLFEVVIHHRMARLDMASYENPERRNKLTNVHEHAMWRAPQYVQQLPRLALTLAEAVVAVVVLGVYSPLLALLLVAGFVPRVLVDVRYHIGIWRNDSRLRETNRRKWYARHHLVEPHSLSESLLFQNVPFFVEQMNQFGGELVRNRSKVEHRFLKFRLWSVMLVMFCISVAVIELTYRATLGLLEIGTLTFYLGSVFSLAASVQMFSEQFGAQIGHSIFVRDMFELFDMKPLVSNPGDSGKSFERIEQIEFRDVHFTYPGGHAPVLKGISLTLTRGQLCGLVAENGSGKSTIAKLLVRAYDPTKGVILVNGVDLRELNLDWWHSQIGMLMQRFSNYDYVTMDQAVRLGRSLGSVGTEEEVLSALRQADALEFVERLPFGVHTMLGTHFAGGVELSGGQYQKSALARVAYRKPQVGVFDEPTSSIDAGSEERIMSNLVAATGESASLLITHRFYMLRQAHVIYVLADGRVIESGSHDQLMKRGGVYAERFLRQAKAYDLLGELPEGEVE